MKFPLIALLVCLCSTAPQWMHAAEGPTVLLDVSVANGARLMQHWNGSIYAKVWNDPALAALRAKLDTAAPSMQADIGFDPFSVLPALVSARLRVFAITAAPAPGGDAMPPLMLQADVGALAARVFAGLRGKGSAAKVPGADEAIQLPGDPGQELRLARFGTVLVLGTPSVDLTPHAVPDNAHDLSVHLDGEAIGASVRTAVSDPADRAKVDPILAVLKPYLVAGQADLDVVPAGLHATFSLQTTFPWLGAFDRGWLGHLPATVYSCAGSTIDGAVLWHDLVQPLLAALAGTDGKTADQVIGEVDAGLHGLGLKAGLVDLVSGVKGPIFTATSSGIPFPGFTIGVPRSPALDELILLALTRMHNDPPAEGQSVAVVLPNLPMPINLAMSPTSWVASTDPAITSTWNGPAASAWLATPLGALAQSKLDDHVCSLSVSDTATELRSLQGFLGMGMSSLPFEPAVKQAILNGVNLLIAQASPSFEVMRQQEHRLSGESQGMLAVGSTNVAVVAIVAAIAIPNLLESRITANEAAAASSLKAGVFPAEVQFQAGGYHDRDHDGIGDFGFFGEMAGGPIPGNNNGIALSLLPPTWNAVTPLINNYHFAVYLPDGAGGALSADHDHDVAKSTTGGPETGFVAYAWPDSISVGRRMFAITAAGTVYTAPFLKNDHPPAWNALFGDHGWTGTPVWQVYRRGQAPAPAPRQTPPPPQPAPPTPPVGGANF